jgi:hypothetical protein
MLYKKSKKNLQNPTNLRAESLLFQLQKSIKHSNNNCFQTQYKIHFQLKYLIKKNLQNL